MYSASWRDGRVAVLLLQYQPTMLGLARKQLGSSLQAKVEAEDVLQEALRRTLPNLTDQILEDEAQFVLYVCTAIQSVTTDVHRSFTRQGRNVQREADGSTSHLAAHSTLSPSRVLMRHERADAVRAAIAGLPQDERELVEAHHLRHESTESIAAQLGLSADTVRRRLRRALEKIGRALRPILGEPPDDDSSLTDRRNEDPPP